MRITEVNEENIAAAARIHAESWQESHKSFCSAEFVAKHTVSAQAEYLRREMAAGKRIYMLIAGAPVGIVSVQGNLIENLYVLPGEQNKGYGTRLLNYAIEQCEGVPSLWILNINEDAYRLYTRRGFAETGNRKQLKGNLFELELAWSGQNTVRQKET